MNRSENFNFYLPSRDDEDIVDVNQISENFTILDEEVSKSLTKDNIGTYSTYFKPYDNLQDLSDDIHAHSEGYMYALWVAESTGGTILDKNNPTDVGIVVFLEKGGVYEINVADRAFEYVFNVSDGGGISVDLSEYVKKTEYANVGVAGVVKLATLQGLKTTTFGNESGYLVLDPAPESVFPYRPTTAGPMPITLSNVDFAVKACLSDGKQVVTWTDGEKAAARELLGAAAKDGDEFELIETVTVEDSELKEITRSVDVEGNALALKRLMVKINAQAGNSQGLVIMRTFKGNLQLGGASISGAINTGARYSYASFYPDCGYWNGHMSSAISDISSPASRLGMSFTYTLSRKVATYPWIDKFTITSNSTNVYFPVGTKIEIWGVKA